MRLARVALRTQTASRKLFLRCIKNVEQVDCDRGVIRLCRAVWRKMLVCDAWRTLPPVRLMDAVPWRDTAGTGRSTEAHVTTPTGTVSTQVGTYGWNSGITWGKERETFERRRQGLISKRYFSLTKWTVKIPAVCSGYCRFCSVLAYLPSQYGK